MELFQFTATPENRIKVESMVYYYFQQGWDIADIQDLGELKITTLIWPFACQPYRLRPEYNKTYKSRLCDL